MYTTMLNVKRETLFYCVDPIHNAREPVLISDYVNVYKVQWILYGDVIVFASQPASHSVSMNILLARYLKHCNIHHEP